MSWISYISSENKLDVQFRTISDYVVHEQPQNESAEREEMLRYRNRRGFYSSPEGIKEVETCTEPVKDHAFTAAWMSRLVAAPIPWPSRDLDQTRPLGLSVRFKQTARNLLVKVRGSSQNQFPGILTLS